MKNLEENEIPEEFILWYLSTFKFDNNGDSHLTAVSSVEKKLKKSEKVFLLVWVPENAFDDECRTIDVYSSKEKLLEDHKDAKEFMGTDVSGYFWEEMEIKK